MDKSNTTHAHEIRQFQQTFKTSNRTETKTLFNGLKTVRMLRSVSCSMSGAQSPSDGPWIQTNNKSFHTLRQCVSESLVLKENACLNGVTKKLMSQDRKVFFTKSYISSSCVLFNTYGKIALTTGKQSGWLCR